MRLFPSSAWRYAAFMILLFAIVAIAALTIIENLQTDLVAPDARQVVHQISLAVWALTLGCLFLAGGLGLWAIRSTAEIEGRRRVGRFVDAMDYLSDGLLALDRRGQIEGLNPSARRMAPGATAAGVRIQEVFPCLTEADLDQLLDPRQPREVEAECACAQGLRTLRFRSQPSEGLMLVLVSDITHRHWRELRRHQQAQLEVIGRIAAGVAHDFNNILCAISGHASLMQRLDMEPDTRRRSIRIIDEETRKGIHVSRQLLELSRAGQAGKPSASLATHVEEAAGLLGVALSAKWTVRTAIEGEYPVVPLSGPQIEQAVLHLGVLAADALPRPGTLTVTLSPPGTKPWTSVGPRYAAVIIVSGESAPAMPDTGPPPRRFEPLNDDAGVISSVVRTMVEGVRGHMDQLVGGSGLCVFRICLPPADTGPGGEWEPDLPERLLTARLAALQVLLAGVHPDLDPIEDRVRRLGARVERRLDLAAALSVVERNRELDVLVLDRGLLGNDAESLLRAVRQISPRIGLVLCGAAPGEAAFADRFNLVLMPPDAATAQRLLLLLKARSLVT